MKCCAADDHFIVRQFSPVVTIGGGAVLDHWRGGRCCETRTHGVSETLEGSNHEEILAAMTERAILVSDTTKLLPHRVDGYEFAIRQETFRYGHAKQYPRTVAAGFGESICDVRRKIWRRSKIQKEIRCYRNIAGGLRSSLGKRVRPIFPGRTRRACRAEELDNRRTGEESRLRNHLFPKKQEPKSRLKRRLLPRVCGSLVKEVLAKLTVEAKRARNFYRFSCARKPVRVADLVSTAGAGALRSSFPLTKSEG